MDTHPSIVSIDTFNKAQDRIKYITENTVKCHKQSTWLTGLVKCPVCGKSMIKITKDTLCCIGNRKHKTCENKSTLKVKELEEFCKNIDLKKVDHIIFNKVRTERFSRIGYKPMTQPPRNIRKEDFKIIWKK